MDPANSSGTAAVSPFLPGRVGGGRAHAQGGPGSASVRSMSCAIDWSDCVHPYWLPDGVALVAQMVLGHGKGMIAKTTKVMKSPSRR